MDKFILNLKSILGVFLLLFVGLLSAQQPVYEPAPLVVEFSPPGGFFSDSTNVQLLSPGAAIYFTTDGTEPRAVARNRYTGMPIPVSKTTVIRSIAVMAGEKSHVFSSTYFLGEPETTLPVVSVSINSSKLFDPVRGLFQRGTNYVDSVWYKPGANFWSRKEHMANFEFFEPDGKMEWSNEVGFRLFGGMSRLFPQKSFSISARGRYGNKRVRHKVFGKGSLKKFKHIVLRNSGSDFGKSHFRDALMTDLVKKWDLDLQDYRPSHVYINGEYWGIYNLREKINRYFISAHHDVHKDSIDLLEHRLNRKNGSTKHYRALLDYLENNDLSKPSNYAYVQSLIELDNFIDYQIAQIYFDNQDAGGNIKYWRPQTPDGKWRWILYDTDWGFGLNEENAYQNNSLEFHTAPDGPHWPNPPWSTFILRKLLENKNFEREFITRFADRLNSDLSEDEVARTIDKFYNRLLPEMPRHLERWDLKPNIWNQEVEEMRTFGAERPRYIRRFLEQKFDVGEQRSVIFDVTQGGKVVINERVKVRGLFSAKYFEKIPIRIRAKADLGYRFVRWEGNGVNSESSELLLEITRADWKVKAIFEKYRHPLANKVIINEVSCNNRKSGDWLEIYNQSSERVNLEGWIVTDSKNEFVFPKYILPPKGYVVLCEDSVDFVKIHPEVQSLIGGLPFGLNKISETIQLFSPEAAAVDSMGYTLEPTDSVFSYDLLLPELDNGRPDNWAVNTGIGSPGSANAFYIASRIEAKRTLWMQLGGAAAVILICIMLLYLRAKKVL